MTVTRATASLVIALGLAVGSCAPPRPPTPTAVPAPPPRPHQSLHVTATAFNSVPHQTDDDATVTAFGARLAPGMKVIAVSDDLYALGLREGTRVRIEGLHGDWEVADRMAPRWRRRIDVYMGKDEAAAKRFGRRRVIVRWRGQ